MNRVEVHPLSDNPDAAWSIIYANKRTYKIVVRPPSRQPNNNFIRFVCMSDTHSLTSQIDYDIPKGDVFLHAGDFTRCGQRQEVIDFNNWLGTLPHKYKIVIAGNHELSFDSTFTRPMGVGNRATLWEDLPTLGMSTDNLNDAISTINVKQELTNCIYLEDSFITINGIKIYGTPWQPEFCKWAFNLPRGQPCLDKWNLIPADTDILLTHTPPLGQGDKCCSGVRAGCVDLLNTVQRRVKPRYHVFGHIHEGYGITTDAKIMYVNASTCDSNNLPINYPIMFDMKVKSN